MLNNTKTPSGRPRISVTLSNNHFPDCSPESRQEQASPLSEVAASVIFPISAIVRASYPRTSAWAGLSEAGQILCEAEAHKGAPLTQEELRALEMAHLDAYDRDWAFQRRGISEEWIGGWSHAFALYAQAVARARDSDPLHGLGQVSHTGTVTAQQTCDPQPQTTIRFRHARLRVTSHEDFWQGIWEGQLAALDEQPAWQETQAGWGCAPARSLSVARYCDDLLDLVYELGNHGLDFVTGYVLGYAEGLLCGRTFPPARVRE